MRRSILSLMAVVGCVWGWTTSGEAEEFNPFAARTSLEEAIAPLTPAPEPLWPGEIHSSPFDPRQAPHAEEGGLAPYEAGGGHHEPGHGEPHHGHEDQHHGHEEHHMHHHHHHHEHEEPIGNIRVTPLYREIDSSIWRAVFDNMYSVNVGTTFWQPEHHRGNFSTQTGLVTEFQYSSLSGRNTNLSSLRSAPFGIRENLRVRDADIYAGNIGLSFVANTYLPNSHRKLELGFSPLLTIGNLNADLVPHTPASNQRTIVLDRRAAGSGTIVGGDFRVWTGIQTESGFRAGLTGFYGVAETSSVFGSSNTFNTYGGGFYVELPTRFVPHEFPAPAGTFQWFEEIFGLD